MIRLARTSDAWYRLPGGRWRRWTRAQDLSEAGKINRTLLDVDGPALPSVGWWIFGAAMAWVVVENL